MIPRLIKYILEGRVLAEASLFYITRPVLIDIFKSGDDHPVIIIPGFMTDDWSTIPMRRYIKDIGYSPKGWNLGINHPGDEIERYVVEVCKLVQQQRKQYKEKVTIIGWSLGGVIARCVGRKIPNSVRQIITLGSPLSDLGLVGPPVLRSLYQRRAKRPLQELIDIVGDITVFNGVPTTSVYSKSDGIVDWKYSLLQEHPYHQNIEVDCSHIGMGTSVAVSVIIGGKLQHCRDTWSPILKNNWRTLLIDSM